MPPRRGHEKTKTGCKTCRKRRVKCSEEFPVCNNCLKREVVCTWAEPTNGALRTASAMYSSPDPLTTVSAVSTFPMDLPTLELMHHFTNVACYSLHGYNPDLVEIWKSGIPSLAFSTQAHFLLHAMFAMSALHLSEIQSEPTLSLKYRYTAATHFDHAKRESDLVRTANDGLGVSFVSHLLLALYSFSTSHSLHDSEWIRLIRSRFPFGVKNVWSQYASGPIGPLILNITDSYRHTTALDLQHGPLPHYLSSIHLPTAGTPDPEEVMDPHLSETYAEAVRMTRRMLAASSEVGFEIQYIAWIVHVSDDYLRLLWERRPRALVIAAHYCAIMTRVAYLHPMTWWIQMRQRWQDEADNIRKEVGDAWKDWMPSEDWFIGMDSMCLSEPSIFLST